MTEFFAAGRVADGILATTEMIVMLLQRRLPMPVMPGQSGCPAAAVAAPACRRGCM